MKIIKIFTNNEWFSCARCQEINLIQPCEACPNYRTKYGNYLQTR